MTETPQDTVDLIDQLNRDYETLHTEKEDAFWASYMGLSDNPDEARQTLSDAEIKQNRWLQDPDRLIEIQAA